MLARSPRSNRLTCRRGSLVWAIALAAGGLAAPGRVHAQQFNAQAPLQAVGDRFFERNGVSFSARGSNFFFDLFGGVNQAAPPFGGFDPNAGGNFGLGFGGGGITGGLLLASAQGASRSNVMQSGNLTMMSGVPGFVGDASLSPFVTGIVPVVGGGGPAWKQQVEGRIPAQPLQISLQPKAQAGNEVAPAKPFAPAQVGAMSLEEIRQQRQQSDSSNHAEVRQQLESARAAAAAGKPNVAKIYYQMALRRAQGDLKQQVQAELDRLAKDHDR